MSTLALTGHRPDKLWGYDATHPGYLALGYRLRDFIRDGGYTHLISGMALGADTIFARVALKLMATHPGQYTLECALPFPGQEARWPAADQLRYRDILSRASRVTTVTTGGFSADKMQARNRYMVDQADTVLAIWDGSAGGTGHAVGYARRQGKDLQIWSPAQLYP